MTRRWSLVVWGVVAACAVSHALTIAAVLFGDPSETIAPHPAIAAVLILTLATIFPVTGALIATRQPRNAIGWLLLGFGVALALVTTPAAFYADHAFYHDAGRLPGDVAAAFVTQAASDIGFFACIVFIPLLFPDGRPPSRRWNPVLWLGIATTGAYAIAHALKDGTLGDEAWDLQNPIGVVPSAVVDVLNGLQGLAALLGIAALAVRFRRSRGDERLQLKWLVFAVGVMFAGLPLAYVGAVTDIGVIGGIAWGVVLLGLLGIPIATAIAILRYRLYEIDVILRRTLVYGALIACVVGAYVGVIALADAILREQAGVAAAAAATAVVAILFDPLRARLHAAVNRLLYGQRDDPALAIAALGERLQAAVEPTALLPAVVETVATTLRLPYVAIELDGEVVAAHGRGSGTPTRLPVEHEGRVVGSLLAAPRPGQDALDARDLGVLEELAHETGGAAVAAAMMSELQRARAHIVAAREEERRAIRNDLHDGVGPVLAAIVFELDAARNRLAADRDAALGLVRHAHDQTVTAIADVRALCDALGPAGEP